MTLIGKQADSQSHLSVAHKDLVPSRITILDMGWFAKNNVAMLLRYNVEYFYKLILSISTHLVGRYRLSDLAYELKI